MPKVNVWAFKWEVGLSNIVRLMRSHSHPEHHRFISSDEIEGDEPWHRKVISGTQWISLELKEQVHELSRGTEIRANIKFTDSWAFPYSLLPQTQKWTLKRILRLLNKQERRAQVTLYTPQMGSLSVAWIFSVVESHTMRMSLGRHKWGKWRVLPCVVKEEDKSLHV